MALPNLTAGRSFSPTTTSFQGRATAFNGGGVEMALNIGCLMGCGAKALGCIPCGTNIPCWIGCAGPEVVSCVTRCF